MSRWHIYNKRKRTTKTVMRVHPNKPHVHLRACHTIRLFVNSDDDNNNSTNAHSVRYAELEDKIRAETELQAKLKEDEAALKKKYDHQHTHVCTLPRGNQAENNNSRTIPDRLTFARTWFADRRLSTWNSISDLLLLHRLQKYQSKIEKYAKLQEDLKKMSNETLRTWSLTAPPEWHLRALYSEQHRSFGNQIRDGKAGDQRTREK